VTGTNLSGINNRGEIVGLFEDRSRVMRNFLGSPRGRYTIIDPPGSFPDEEAVDINNRGEIVGDYDTEPRNTGSTSTPQAPHTGTDPLPTSCLVSPGLPETCTGQRPFLPAG
jgi:hypothetical protein